VGRRSIKRGEKRFDAAHKNGKEGMTLSVSLPCSPSIRGVKGLQSEVAQGGMKKALFKKGAMHIDVGRKILQKLQETELEERGSGVSKVRRDARGGYG